MATGVKQQQRRGTAAEWNTANHVLDEGELGVTTDTGIIKIGDGVNGWNDLPPAFNSDYLPILGKAADSELLDGIDSSGYFKTADASTAATADKLAKRTADGRILAADGTTSTEVVNYAQMAAGLLDAKRIPNSRTVSANFTLAAGDVGSIVFVNGSAWNTTVVCTIPDNATVAIPVGSVIHIRTATAAQSPVSLATAGGVTVVGQTWIAGQGSYLMMVKNGTDSWVVVDVAQSPGPVLHRRIKPGSDNSMNSASFVALRLDGADEATLRTTNVDSLGSGTQYNSGTNLYRAVCRRSGYYDVTLAVAVASSFTGRFYIRTKINGTLQKFGSNVYRSAFPDFHTQLSGVIPLTVDDYLEVEAQCEGGTTGQEVSDQPYASSFLSWAWRRPL